MLETKARRELAAGKIIGRWRECGLQGADENVGALFVLVGQKHIVRVKPLLVGKRLDIGAMSLGLNDGLRADVTRFTGIKFRHGVAGDHHLRSRFQLTALLDGFHLLTGIRHLCERRQREQKKHNGTGNIFLVHMKIN